MAFFKKIFGGKEPEKPRDFRSKRGGRRAPKAPDAEIPEIPLDEAPAQAPAARAPAPPRAPRPPSRGAQAPTASPRAPAASPRAPAASPGGPAVGPRAPTVSARAPTSQVRGPARPATARVAPRAPGPTTRRTVRIAGRGTPIGQILLEAGKITTEQLTKALQTKEKQRGLLGQILRKMDACTDIDVANALQKQFRVTSVDLAGVGFKADTLALVPKQDCLAGRLMPIEQLGPMLCLAMANVLNRKAIQAIEERTKLKVKPLRCPWPQIQNAIGKIYTDKIEAAAQSGEAVEKAAQVAEKEAEEEKKEVDEAAALAEEQIKKAEEGARKKAEKEARKKQLQRYKKKADALYQIADAAFASGALGDAKKRLEEAINLVPDYAEAKKLLAKVDKEFTRTQAEEEKRRKAEEAKRQKLTSLFEAAQKAKDERNFGEAKATLKKVFKLEPGHARAAAMIASIEEGEQARDREEGKRARVEALMQEARQAKEKGELDAAKSRLSEAIQLDPENSAIRDELNSISEALAALATEEARRKIEEERRAKIAAALAAATDLRSEGELAQARVKLEDVLAIDPENEEVTSLLIDLQESIRAREGEAAAKRRIGALIEEARGAVSSDPEKAQRIVEEVLSLDPENADVASLREAIAGRMAEIEKLRAKEEDLRRETDRLMSEVQAARAADEFEEAAGKLREVMALDADNVDAMALLAAVEDGIREREEVAQLAVEDRTKREEERRKDDEQRRAKFDGLLSEAGTLLEAGDPKAAQAKAKEALELEPLHAEARGILSKAETELARKKEEEERLARLHSLLQEARGLKEQAELEAASLKVKEVLAREPEHEEAKALQGEIEDGIRKQIQDEARKRAEQERRKRVVELLAEAKEARAMDEMETARASIMEALALAPGDPDASSLLSSMEAEVREKEEAEARKKAEEERRARAEELLSEAREELDADIESARLRLKEALELLPDLHEARGLLDEVEAKIEERKVAKLSPVERAAREILVLEPSLPRFRDQVVRAVKEKGLAAETPEEAFASLPVAEIFARSRAEYVSMAEAALVGHPVEEIALGGEEADLEPPPLPTPPIPAVERALQGLPEVPMIEVGGVLQAVLISEQEFASLGREFEPDLVQTWCETYATAGPIIAAPYEE